jgi:hypothetical protein
VSETSGYLNNKAVRYTKSCRFPHYRGPSWTIQHDSGVEFSEGPLSTKHKLGRENEHNYADYASVSRYRPSANQVIILITGCRKICVLVHSDALSRRWRTLQQRYEYMRYTSHTVHLFNCHSDVDSHTISFDLSLS